MQVKALTEPDRQQAAERRQLEDRPDEVVDEGAGAPAAGEEGEAVAVLEQDARAGRPRGRRSAAPTTMEAATRPRGRPRRRSPVAHAVPLAAATADRQAGDWGGPLNRTISGSVDEPLDPFSRKLKVTKARLNAPNCVALRLWAATTPSAKLPTLETALVCDAPTDAAGR